jgi:hypothetical protein
MRLTRRTFIMASGVSAGWAVTGCAVLAPSAPLHSALVPYKTKREFLALIPRKD